MSFDKNTFVLSLGGSLVVPNGGIDTQFLSDFNTFIRNKVSSKKRRFFIVVGGGATTRHYQEAARVVRKQKIEDVDLDWLGIHATRLNAQMVRTIFQDIADPRILKHYEIILKIDAPIAIAAGWKPGWSTDYCAITICQDYGIKSAINMTNVDQVHDKDPNKFSDAKPLVDVSWRKYRAMVGDTWTPGMNVPFDPIASKLADELGVTVKILNGKNLDNLSRALDDKSFVGTTIQ
ncbi:UMP kinase [Candidatus Gottesmanbacteria bacterium]|nr:UMP kinase [Candidatus Gottesmanbacteria bacterium]